MSNEERLTLNFIDAFELNPYPRGEIANNRTIDVNPARFERMITAINPGGVER
jgi:hypothetical protein